MSKDFSVRYEFLMIENIYLHRILKFDYFGFLDCFALHISYRWGTILFNPSSARSFACFEALSLAVW